MKAKERLALDYARISIDEQQALQNTIDKACARHDGKLDGFMAGFEAAKERIYEVLPSLHPLDFEMIRDVGEEEV